MRSFNDIVYGILNENDGQSIPDPGVFGPPKRRDATALRDDYFASGMLPVLGGKPSIGDRIYSLIKSLDEDTKTNTGGFVTDMLEDIFDELEGIAAALKRANEPGRDLDDYLKETEKLIRRL